MLFHLGAIWRLNDAGLLPKLKRISSVSGGSITAGVLALAWQSLAFTSTGIANAFQNLVVKHIRNLAMRTIDAGSIIGGILSPWSTAGELIAKAYRQVLFGDATLQDLPDAPRFVLNATNIQSGALWRFSKPYMRDYRVGEVKKPTVPLATAVAASSAFPPVLSPVRLSIKTSAFTPGSGQTLQRPPFTTDVHLSDGGIYDNLGLETAWKRYQTILVSDAGAAFSAQENPHSDWARHSLRVFDLIDNQVRSLRKRQLIDSYRENRRQGAYWGIASDPKNYQPALAFDIDARRSQELAQTPTRLRRLPAERQERLINWGYAIADAALRKHFDSELPKPLSLPYPARDI
jgi:NTE family protein